jgi:hypothetical protein
MRRFSQRSLHGPMRRIGEWWRRRIGKRFVPAKRVRRIRLNGRDFKRLTLPDTAVAQRIADRLEIFRAMRCFPELVAVMDAELLLEFVPGRSLAAPFDAEAIERLGRFFGALYSVDRRRVPTAETPFPMALQRDLAFLRDVGVFDAEVHRDLAAAAHACAPEFVHVGWDYLDPLPRNFVVSASGRFVAVDVESLEPDRLLGSGVAKCFQCGAEAARARLLAAIAAESGPDLVPSMAFVELHFLAGWTKHAFLKGRGRLVDPSRFDPFREKSSAATIAAVTPP